MPNHPVPDSIPISALNTLEYCPRRFYYQFVQGVTLVNEHVLEGTLAHQRVHQQATHVTSEGEIETTRLYLFSETLRIAGFTDVIEEQGGKIIPVEYKRGQQGRHGGWLNDAVQLCAQALCLEERRADQQRIDFGYIFYIASRRRAQVLFTTELRERTLETITHAFQVATLETPPPPLSGKDVVRCPGCSLLPLCLPDEVTLLQSRKGGSYVNALPE
ncbi:MAG: CRISPR-associated protein Cas4 [Ktedonobacteraceae bacterium]